MSSYIVLNDCSGSDQILPQLRSQHPRHQHQHQLKLPTPPTSLTRRNQMELRMTCCLCEMEVNGLGLIFASEHSDAMMASARESGSSEGR